MTYWCDDARLYREQRTLDAQQAAAKPHCRWCRALVIRGLPCTCQRAQEEARRVRHGS